MQKSTDTHDVRLVMLLDSTWQSETTLRTKTLYSTDTCIGQNVNEEHLQHNTLDLHMATPNHKPQDLTHKALTTRTGR